MTKTTQLKKTPLRRRSKNKKAILLRRAVIVFNAWIRERDRVKLKGRCYTCHREGSEAGHWKHSCKSLKFNEKTVHLQCGYCNRWLSGNLAVYTLRLIDEYGLEIVKQLEKKSVGTHNFNINELQEIIKKYG